MRRLRADAVDWLIALVLILVCLAAWMDSPRAPAVLDPMPRW